MRFWGLVMCALVCVGCATVPEGAAPEVTMAPLFSDHMVVQREAPVRVWGKAAPGARVTVTLAGDSARTRADEQGRWIAELDALPAGGPHVLRAESGAAVHEVSDVLAGDVWLCSGQSNMAWPVFSGTNGAANGKAEVAAAHWPQIRLIQIARKGEMTPREDAVTEGWEVCSPETVGDFSAVGYFFGRELNQHLKVPIGLINSSYGGTMVEAWTSDEGLHAVPEFVPLLDHLKAHPDTVQQIKEKHDQQMEEWLGSLNALDAGFGAWSAETLDTADWTAMALPGNWEERGYPALDGVGWFRKEVELPASWAGQTARIKLGNVNDRIQIYVNGQELVHWAHNAQAQAGFDIPADMLKTGRNVIVARVFDAGGSGGLFGYAEDYELRAAAAEAPVSLAGDWQFKVGAEIKDFAPPPFPPAWHPDSPNGTARLYNSMIAPLVKYPLRGVIWYQGESNAARAAQYAEAFPALIKDWRAQWDQPDLPFLFVQLANYRERQPEPVEDSWAELREAQRQTLALPETGMAVIIDIGEADDIHPANKQDVGKRLALAARHVAYDEALVYSGPVFERLEVEGAQARVRFTEIGGGLMAQGGVLKGFTVAGEDRKFHWADAKIEGDSVLVSSAAVAKPVAVRYGWGTNPEVNLYNAEGLPASPFRTDDWPFSTEGNLLKLP